MSKYILGHSQSMMDRFRLRSLTDGFRFIEPLLPENGCVLDIGCGSGALVRLLAKKSHRINFIGIDRSIFDASQYECDELIRNLLLVQGDAYKLPLENESVDFLYAQALFMYLDNPAEVLKEFYRVLKPKGKIALRNSTSVVNNMTMFIENELLDKVLDFNLKENLDNPNVALDLKFLLGECGFSNVSVSSSIETSKSQEDFSLVARSVVELLQSDFGINAVKSDIISESDRVSLVQGVELWGGDQKAYNRAIWLEHIAEK